MIFKIMVNEILCIFKAAILLYNLKQNLLHLWQFTITYEIPQLFVNLRPFILRKFFTDCSEAILLNSSLLRISEKY